MDFSPANILNLLGDKKIAGILKVFIPDGFSRGKGRPRKISFSDKLKDGTDIAKLAMALIGSVVLSDRGAITMEQMLAVVAYTVEHLKDTEIVYCFPTSPKWIVRSALVEMGYSADDIPSITWDEFMTKLAELYVTGMQTQQIQSAWVQAQKQGWKPEQYNEWLQKIQQQRATASGQQA
jgi:hypothetical protein